jgi:hypothetical protein
MSYNGWRNYETWVVVKLWIDNEEGDYRYWREATQEAIAAQDEDETPEERGRNAAYELSKRLKAEINESAPEMSGMFADLLNSAIQEVDFEEIASAMIENEGDKCATISR